MSTEKFEPFGESLPENGFGEPDQPRTASAVLSTVGQCVFWLLVVVIVCSRVVYFSPAPSFSPHVVWALIHGAEL